MKQLEQNFINQICQDIEKLNGTDFEFFIKDIFPLIINEKVNHKGHNLNKKPVKSTADFFTDDFKIVGQCGTDTEYFDFPKKPQTTTPTKPIKDIDSAIINHSQCEIIYLFSNQRATGGQLSKLDTAIKQKGYNQTIEIYDAEKIAKFILEEVLNPKIIKAIASYLPTAYELYKLIPKTNKIPNFSSKKYFIHNSEEKIRQKLLENHFLQIYGISGLGKTEIAKSISNNLSDDFETQIWIDGDNTRNINFNYEAVYISKFNSLINLKTLLENHKIILILDNFNKNLNEIKNQFDLYNKHSSICIVTSLQKNLNNNNTFELDYLDDKISKKILFETNNKPSVETANEIIKYVNGYPLLLTLIRDNIDNNEDTWEDILSDLKSIVKLEDPENNKKISIRVLEKHLNSIKEDIKWIFLLKSRFISKEFFKFCIGHQRVKTLIKRSIISDTESSFFTVHQIILDAIIDISVNKFDDTFAYDELNQFLTEQNEKKTIGYFNFLFTHNDFINRIYSSLQYTDKLKKQILYSKIQARNEEDEIFFLEEINKFELGFNDKVDVLLLVEKIEIELYKAKKEYQKTNEQKYITECKKRIEDIEQIISKCKIKDIDIYLNHHLGKIYIRIKEYNKALELFNKVLKKDENADYTKLQIARILSTEEHFDKKELEKIFNDIFIKSNNWEKQSLSVLLAMYDIIAGNNMSEYRKQYIDDNINDFVNKLLYSLTFGFEQPFSLLAKLSYHFSYNHKQEFLEICNNLPLPSTIKSNNNLKYAFATIQVAYYKGLKYSDIAGKEEKMEKAFNYSEAYFKAIDLNDFERGKFVDLYIEANKYKNALLEIEKIDDKNVFYYQKLCKIYRGLNNYDDALDAIDNAIDLIENSTKKYLCAFLNDKAETYYAKNDKENAVKTLKEAINEQKNQNTKKYWKEKLNAWEKE